jgi:hydrogenase nickel incorporation protein HypA/HybF
MPLAFQGGRASHAAAGGGNGRTRDCGKHAVHELALAESVLSIAEEAARRNDAARVTAIRVEIGALANVVPEALRFCFEAVRRDTIAAGASLDIVTIPGEAWCMACSTRVPLRERGDACRHCGGYQLAPVQGEAMRVREIAIA